MKKILALAGILGIVLALILTSGGKAKAVSDPTIYFFWGDGCPHCAAEEKFFIELKKDYPNIDVAKYEVWHSAENRDLMTRAAKALEVNVSGVPFTVIGAKSFIGYSDGSTDNQIRDALIYYKSHPYTDILASVLAEQNTPPVGETGSGDGSTASPQKIRLPFLGDINIKDFSLPALAVIIGTIDGFNPCSMWVLLFLIGLLLEVGDRRKMIVLGGAFILTEALTYFLFMTAWLQFILFIGFIAIVRIAIGLAAITSGAWSLSQLLKKKDDSGCEVTGEEKRNKIFDRISKIARKKEIILAVLGVVALAFSVNLIEMVCSAGLPALFTQILALNNLSEFQRIMYLVLYDFFFMLDDLIVFIAALATFQLLGITTRYSRWAHIIGGIIMIIVGLLLIFYPQALMFG